ncbi:MAG TPA: L,D-transpeptidase family protein [Actinomycetes bacterium]|nr:L,D-transpeptidase family protein [Actinomycetes bacterium]
MTAGAVVFVLVILTGAVVELRARAGDRDEAAAGTATTSGGTPVAGRSPAPTTVPPTSTTVQPRPRPEPRNLTVGSRGRDVRALQTSLIRLAYADLARATGTFDEQTRHAVVSFQKVNGLDRDGIAGPRTLAALRAPRVPRPRDPGRDFHVETDLDRQVTYLVSGGRVSAIIDASTASGRTYEVDGDLRLAVTPTGEFRIQRRLDGWRRSDLGLLYRPAYFVGGYAYHGAPSVPPFPASHGCIRMTLSTMDRFSDRFAVGTRVLVYRT